MKKEVRALIERAKAKGEPWQAQAPAVPHRPATPRVVSIEAAMAEPEWFTFAQLAEKFTISYDKVNRVFRNRPGVLKIGSDYRVPGSVVRAWLSEALERIPLAA